jgi:SAM-dependent methyltransferase
MIKMARRLNQDQGLDARIHLLPGYINDIRLPQPHYDVIFSNSLLHHLQEPLELWQLITSHSHPGTRLFIMDLLRPENLQSAQYLLDLYAADESEILRQDFYHSLCAAYTITEVEQQLAASHIDFCHIRQVSDRHLIIYGTAP